MQARAMVRICLLLLGCAAGAGLSSCKLMSKNYELAQNRVAPPVADDVMVENAGALPAVAPPEHLAPSAPAAAATAPGGRVVVVQPGDTLSAIARRNHTTVAALCSANGISPSVPIRSGQKLRVPGGAGAAAASSPKSAPAAYAARSYTVRPGDTLSGIAVRHGVSSAALMRANNMTPQQADRIRAGQTLRIPAR